MKGLLLFVPALLGVLAFAQEDYRCEDSCPQVRCAADDPVKLCKCINLRESRCSAQCPDYKPQYQICPRPTRPVRPTPVLPPKECTCEQRFCIQVWPQSCYCANAEAKRCWEECGRRGPEPAYQSCPPLEPVPTFRVSVIPEPTPVPLPTPINPICGGGLAGYRQCDEGYTCIQDPRRPGCGPACDDTGICIEAENNFCGGFAGFACRTAGQICVDDPRDDCDPRRGGADCGGVCIWDDEPLP